VEEKGRSGNPSAEVRTGPSSGLSNIIRRKVETTPRQTETIELFAKL
jgi:hypothetical protein